MLICLCRHPRPPQPEVPTTNAPEPSGCQCCKRIFLIPPKSLYLVSERWERIVPADGENFQISQHVLVGQYGDSIVLRSLVLVCQQNASAKKTLHLRVEGLSDAAPL